MHNYIERTKDWHAVCCCASIDIRHEGSISRTRLNGRLEFKFFPNLIDQIAFNRSDSVKSNVCSCRRQKFMERRGTNGGNWRSAGACFLSPHTVALKSYPLRRLTAVLSPHTSRLSLPAHTVALQLLVTSHSSVAASAFMSPHTVALQLLWCMHAICCMHMVETTSSMRGESSL